MKKLIFLLIFFCVIVGFSFYVEMDTQKFIDGLSAPQPVAETVSERPPIPSASEPKPTVVLDASETDTVEREEVVDVVTEKPKANFDWTVEDDASIHKPKQTDPFMDFITEYQAKEQGTWIGDPDEMDPEALHKATYNQLLENFGDIPAVHTVMDYEWKWNNNIEISLDGEIEWLGALMEIFPSESSRKTLAYYK